MLYSFILRNKSKLRSAAATTKNRGGIPPTRSDLEQLDKE